MDDILAAPLWQKILAVAMIVLLLMWGYHSFLYKPKATKLSSLKNQLRAIELELKLITPPEVILKEGIDIREIIKVELDELMKKIPTEKEVPYIIKDLITQVGTGLNIDYNLIKPEPVRPEGAYKRLPLTVDFFSDYSDLNLYIKELKKLPTTIRIDKLNLSRTAKPPQLGVKMEMSAFVMPGGEVTEKTFRPESKPYLFDPFFELKEIAPGVPAPRKKEGLELKGIWFGKKIKAFINESVVSVGDKIEGYTVEDITKAKVTLKKNGVITTLNMEVK